MKFKKCVDKMLMTGLFYTIVLTLGEAWNYRRAITN